MQDFDKIDREVPDLGVRCLPGRVAGVTHLPSQTGILLPDRERYWPDTVTVTSSGVKGVEAGDVWVVAPSHGMFMERIGLGERELRIFGVACPWWESLIAKVTESGLAPGPGWMLVEREKVVPHPLMPLYTGFSTVGTVISDCTDQETMSGQRIEFSHLQEGDPYRRFYVLKDGPQEWCLIRDRFASKKWLRGLEFAAIHD